MDKTICYWKSARASGFEYKIVIEDYSDSKKPIFDNTENTSIDAYDTRQSESYQIYNSAIYCGYYSSARRYYLYYTLFANAPFTIKTYVRAIGQENWSFVTGTDYSYTVENNGVYTSSSLIENAYSSTYTSMGLIESEELYDASSEIGIPIFDNTTEYESYVRTREAGATVNVSYEFPYGENYEYAKLVYKKDKIPADVTDGTAIDIDPTATSVQVEGISKTIGTKYYFAIFTDKSVSDEFVYEVTEPIPRFSMAKKFKTDNGTFNYNIPSWIEDRVLSVLESDPTTTTIYFDVENYPAVANLYSHQFVEYPLQFRTYYGTYPETGSRPATSSYIAKDYKLEWLWTSSSAYRDETDYLKTNGEWVSVYTQGSGRSRADNNFESFVAEMFILDHIEKKGYPAYFSWAHSENWSGRKYQCQISKMGTNSRYADLATAIYNALK